MKISTFIRKIMDNEDYKLKKSLSYNNYSLFKNKENKIDEDIFLEFIKKMQDDDALITIYRDISSFLLIKANITDKIFNELLDMSKKEKFSWNFVYLCHADLFESQQKILKNLGLNDAYFY